jgi:hypothetical protein
MIFNVPPEVISTDLRVFGSRKRFEKIRISNVSSDKLGNVCIA